MTGLTFDIFGVHNSHMAVTYAYGFPGGHWLNEKTANTVISILHLTIHIQVNYSHAGNTVSCLKLHADKCTGENKNRFVLMYVCWRTIGGLQSEVEMSFQESGHTKNMVDRASSRIKRKLKTTNARKPIEMINVVNTSSASIYGIHSANVVWLIWKKVFEQYFKIPSSFHIMKYHIIRFKSEEPGVLHVKDFLFSSAEREFQIMQTGMTAVVIRSIPQSILHDAQYRSIFTPLLPVKSSQQGTR